MKYDVAVFSRWCLNQENTATEDEVHLHESLQKSPSIAAFWCVSRRAFCHSSVAVLESPEARHGLTLDETELTRLRLRHNGITTRPSNLLAMACNLLCCKDLWNQLQSLEAPE